MVKNMRLRRGDVDACPGDQSDDSSSSFVYDSDKRSKQSTEMRRNMLPILPLLALSATFGLLLRPITNSVPVEQLEPVRENVRKRVLEEKECGIWLAPSSLKGHPGFGIYTTRDIGKTESILAGQVRPGMFLFHNVHSRMMPNDCISFTIQRTVRRLLLLITLATQTKN